MITFNRLALPRTCVLPGLESVKVRREALGLTQLELSRRAQVTRSVIAKIETASTVPRYDLAVRIFGALEALEAERAVAGVLKKRVMEYASTGIVYAQEGETVLEAWQKMHDGNLSQLPVMREGRMVGSITEKGVNEGLLRHGDVVKDWPVTKLMEGPFPTVGEDALLVEVVPLLQRSQAVLVLGKGAVIKGILSNTDVFKAALVPPVSSGST